MAKLDSLVVDLQMNTAALRKGIDEAKGMFEDLGKKVAEGAEAFAVFEVAKLAMEGVAKAAEFMKRGIEDATALGSGPARELGETLEHVGLAGRQVGADLMSDLAPALNGLVEYFAGGVNWGKVFANVAFLLGQAFRMLVEPIVWVAGAIKGLVESGNLEGALKGAADATKELAKHGSDFAGSLKTAQEKALAIAQLHYDASGESNRVQFGLKQAQFDSLTGDRRLDRGAGARKQFENFDDALQAWLELMDRAAGETRKAVDLESIGNTVAAEKHKILAERLTQQAGVAMEAADSFTALKERLIKNAQEINNIRFTLGEQLKNIQVKGDIRTQEYNNNYDPRRGFADFNDALAKQTQALDNQAGLMAAADIIEKQGGAAAQGTVLALKGAADEAGRTAQAAGAAADAFFATKDLIKNQILGALAMVGNSLASKLGDLGSTIQAGVEGFKSGGIWGAVLAVLAEFLEKFKGFNDIVKIANSQFAMFLDELGPGLTQVVSGLKQLMGALGYMSNIVMQILNPILKLIGGILSGIAPIFSFIGVILQPIAGSLTTLIDIVMQSLSPAFSILAGILTGIAIVFLGVNEALLYLKLGVMLATQWFDHTFNPTGDHSGSDQAVVDAQNEINQNEATLNQIVNNGIGSLQSFGGAVDTTTQKMAQMNQQLTNVPAGMKIALNRLNASGTGARGGEGAGDSSTGHTVHIQNMTVQTNNYDELLKKLTDIYERKTAQAGGPPPH